MRIPILESAAMSAAADEDVAALARQYGPTVFRAAWRVLGARAAAEDVQQQVFLRLIESPPRNVESWPAYLTTVGDAARDRSPAAPARWRLLAPLWKADEPEDSPAEDAERAEAGRFMRAALARLNPARRVVFRHAASARAHAGRHRRRARHFGKPRQCQRPSRPQGARSDAGPGAKPMNTLDRTLELFASREADAAMVTDSAAQARCAGGGKHRGASRFAGRRVASRGWLAAGASAAVAAVALLWLPLGSVARAGLRAGAAALPRLPHAALRRRAAHEWQGADEVARPCHARRQCAHRCRRSRQRDREFFRAAVMTLHHPAHVATLAPLGAPATQDDAMAWLEEIREFQGEATALPQTRIIDCQEGSRLGARDRRRQHRVVGDGRWIAARDDAGWQRARCSSTSISSSTRRFPRRCSAPRFPQAIVSGKRRTERCSG